MSEQLYNGPRERNLREMVAPDFTYESEDPHKHLKEFHIVCSTMKPPDVQEDHIYLKASPHSLEGVAKDWLYYLAPRSITSWDVLKRMFLEKFFPASRTTTIRKDISGIRKLGRESLYEYWERFKKLCASCPHHQISEQLLLQYFYEGLNSMERSMIDAASGGSLGDMTPVEARHLIEKMASNSQQFSARNDAIVLRGINVVVADSSSSVDRKLEGKLDTLVSLVTQLSMNQKSSSSSASMARRPPPLAPVAQPAQPSTSFEPSLEELVRQMTIQNMQFQQETRAPIQSLKNQMGQMATQLNQEQSQNSYKLPSQTVQNPKNVSAITLRSGKQIDIPIAVPPPPSTSAPVLIPILASAPEQNDEPVGARNFHVGGPSSSTNFDLQQPPIPLPFPPKLIPSKKMEEELCTHKRKMKGNERISMGRNVSALIGKSVLHIPEKCKDPGTFCIPCIIGNSKFENAMLDLVASINFMPLSIFKSLSLGPMQPTGVVIQLANRSVAHPTGFIEDVLVQVDELIFPTDFYVLDMEEGFSHGSALIILGIPFLKIARTKIDVDSASVPIEATLEEMRNQQKREEALHAASLRVPRHPPWTPHMSTNELHDSETQVFLIWRRSLERLVLCNLIVRV
ncbi:uncharacterized protein LOC109793415 [Cajanus cajan]|uniref:uncharacterized protein LOC109793415 n=1 Tax=Cajanus cajan TaxID=3821 RepID=UPI0010FB50DA|nr:uncharacterized protein LOC109793415 [Cajanus cajan]